MKRWFFLILICGLTISLTQTSCNSQPGVPALAAVEGAALPPPNADIQFSASPNSLNPVVVNTISAPESGLQSFALPTVASDTPTPLPATALPTLLPASPTPIPTFTPPALPFTPNDEHYWLWRPIADGGVVWTDKTYPYGGTRGGRLRPHHGVEFNVGHNTEVLSAASGTVLFAGSDDQTRFGQTTNFYGNVIIIQHDSAWNGQAVYTVYGHLNQVFVSEGQTVDAREPIGLSGATGVADGPHLHFEVRVGSPTYESTRNPLLWLYPFKGRGTVAGRVEWGNGAVAEETPVMLHRIDAPTAQYYQTTTYAGSTVNGDDRLGENFAIDDVVAGYYKITIGSGENKISRELWVFEYHTSFEQFTLQPIAGQDVTIEN